MFVCLFFPFLSFDPPPVSIFLSFFICNLPHTPCFSNSISLSCFGRTCWASAKAIMRTVKQRQMNRWERRGEKGRKRGEERERERHEYEVLALLWLLTVHSRMHGHTSTLPPRSLSSHYRAPAVRSWLMWIDLSCVCLLSSAFLDVWKYMICWKFSDQHAHKWKCINLLLFIISKLPIAYNLSRNILPSWSIFNEWMYFYIKHTTCFICSSCS